MLVVRPPVTPLGANDLAKAARWRALETMRQESPHSPEPLLEEVQLFVEDREIDRAMACCQKIADLPTSEHLPAYYFILALSRVDPHLQFPVKQLSRIIAIAQANLHVNGTYNIAFEVLRRAYGQLQAIAELERDCSAIASCSTWFRVESTTLLTCFPEGDSDISRPVPDLSAEHKKMRDPKHLLAQAENALILGDLSLAASLIDQADFFSQQLAEKEMRLLQAAKDLLVTLGLESDSNFSEAEDKLHAILRVNKNHLAALIRMAKILFAQGKWSSARNNFALALGQNKLPEAAFIDAHLHIARIELGFEYWGQAKPHLLRVLEKDRANIDAIIFMIEVSVGMQDRVEGLKYLGMLSETSLSVDNKRKVQELKKKINAI